ncbi:MAG: polysaccharide pyruvyl transferase CsaB [Candidatus Firestonebacteria bacterium]
MMKILISGYYGFKNAGDELILEALLGRFKKILSEKEEIVILSNIPSVTSKLYGVKSINRKNFWLIIKELLNTNLFITGGGGLFQDVTSIKSLMYYLFLIFIAQILNVKTMLYACGIGPINTKIGKFWTRLILKKVDYITLRDNFSYEVLKSIGIYREDIVICADPVVTLNEGNKSAGEILLKKIFKNTNVPILGIAPRACSTSIDFCKVIAEFSDKLIEANNWNVIFIPFDLQNDITVIKNITSKMKKKHFVLDNYTLSELVDVVSALDILLGMRLHSLILACANKIPAIGINYDPKVKNFQQLIDMPCFEIPELSVEQLFDKTIKTYEQRDKYSKILGLKLPELVESVDKPAVIVSNLFF